MESFLHTPSAVMVPLLTLVAHDPFASITAEVPEKVGTPWYQSTGAVGVPEAAESTGMALVKVAAAARLRTVVKKRIVMVVF